jgi:prephenate dehydrogenase
MSQLPVIQPGRPGPASGTPPVFEKIGIVGLGLIGGSIALAARQLWPKALVIGVDNKDVLETAMRLHAIDVAADDLIVLAEADVVILAAPVKTNIALLAELDENIRQPAVITDAGSTKRAIMEAAGSLPARFTFIGGHPLAGAAQGGLEHARADLFSGRPWLLTPMARPEGRALRENDGSARRENDGSARRENDGSARRENDGSALREGDGREGDRRARREDDGREDDRRARREDDGREDDRRARREDDGREGDRRAQREDDGREGDRRGRPLGRPGDGAGRPEPHGAGIDKLTEFIQALGAVPRVMGAQEHDRLLAFLSHLPQLTASALMQVVGDAVGPVGLALAGRGLADTTRLASSPPDIWRDIAATNADEIGPALDALIGLLQDLRQDLPDGDRLADVFTDAGRWRASLKK